MKVREIMSQAVLVIPPEAPLREAAEKMRARNIGMLPVCTGERLVGMVSDRDITIRGVALGLSPDTTPVSEVMSPGVVWCFEDDEVSQVMTLMQDEQVRRIPVMNSQRKLVGIVSLGDLSSRLDDSLATAETLAEISEFAHSN